MRGIKTLLGTTMVLAGLALTASARAQIVVNIGGAPPSCAYGYYGYAPYNCAPMGYYGPGYFYNGIFLGIGPWGGWGYSHGWGSHRFVSEGGGSYHGGPGRVTYHASGNQARGHAVAARRPAPQARASAPRGASAQRSAPHAAAAHSSGGGHAGGESHGGGKH